MKSDAFEFIWRDLSAFLRGDALEDGADTLDELYSGRVELPREIEHKFMDYVESRSADDFSELAIELVRRFELVHEDPSAHLLTLGYLVAVRKISVREAVRLAQVSREEFPRSQQDGIELVSLAERVEEEERIGFLSVDEDRFFEEGLAAYCRGRGFDFAAGKAVSE